MKKYFVFTIFIMVQLSFNSCCSQKLIEGNDIKLFTVEEVNSDFVKLTKKPTSLSVDSNVIKESVYSITLPKDIHKYSSTISSIPNEIVFQFNNKQKLFILENTSTSKDYTSLGLDKEKFKEEINNLKITNSKLETEIESLKKDRVFGIKVVKDYLIIFINVKENRKEQFKKSVLSFELK